VSTVAVSRGPFARRVRVSGTTEAVRAAAAIAPRLAGQNSPTLVITRLVKGGGRVQAGDVLVEFDPQDQARAAFDRRAEYLDLEQQIKRQLADQAASRASEDTGLTQAQNDVERARLEVLKNRFLPPIDAEKNDLALEQAQARLAALQKTYALRRKAAEADRKTLDIRRERSKNALDHAEANAERMTLRAPFQGLAIVQAAFKGTQMAELQEGDEVRAGAPVVNVVDPSAMQVRVRISQTDGGDVSVGQPARISLDAYPGLMFDGRVEQMAPMAVASSVTPAVRSFMAVVSIVGSHANLMPDLTAAVDITVEQRDTSLLLPRESVVVEPDRAWVLVRRGQSLERLPIAIGSLSAERVVVTGGLKEGDLVVRRPVGGV
jgi:multidrug resistance efflux pump